MLVAVIMAGGAGKRFWPLSRQNKPKQFLSITSKMSMIQMTVDRLLGKIKIENIFVVTAKSQCYLVEEQLSDLPKENIIVESEGMNTAPAVALSALFLARKYKPEDKMFILAADHVIRNVDKFIDSLQPAEMASDDGNLVTFGIKPTYPSTGYGYIEGGDKTKNGIVVNNFKEKPDIETAEYFLKSGNYYWNSGMFMWQIRTILEAYHNYLPKVCRLLSDITKKWDKYGVAADISSIYSKMPKIPIDVGIMEQAEKRIVIPVDYGWSDIGGWKALHEISEKDKNGNAVTTECKILDSSNCYVHSDKLVALIGVKNLVVVDTPDVLMIAEKDSSERVKEVVTSLEQTGSNKYL
jgi:mannose-1-phosphate guanylyltransferase